MSGVLGHFTTPLSDGPQRIVCLTEETVETLYLLREDAPIAEKVYATPFHCGTP